MSFSHYKHFVPCCLNIAVFEGLYFFFSSSLFIFYVNLCSLVLSIHLHVLYPLGYPFECPFKKSLRFYVVLPYELMTSTTFFVVVSAGI